MAEGIVVRPLETLDDARAASALFDRIWGERRVMGAPLLRAMASHGGQVLAAYRGDEMIGAQAGLVGIVEGRPVLHSHITGVAEEAQHQGVGFLLKVAQRQWCLDHGIDRVTWTFDPMVARNAYFNLVKLGAIAERFHRDYYGEMADSFNAGDPSDRLEVVWDLGSERVRRALAGERPHLENTDMPHPHVEVPDDYHQLRRTDPEAAAAARDVVSDRLERLFADGHVATGFDSGSYVLERR